MTNPHQFSRAALAAACLVVCAADCGVAAEQAEHFGPHSIERGPGERSFTLRLASDNPAGFIAVRCLADEQAITVQVGAPKRDGGIAARQTITVWSDKTPATDIVVSGDPTGAYGIAVMNESAGVEADAAFSTLFEAVASAEREIAYKIGADEVIVDATHLQAARARFAALCARTAAPPDNSHQDP